MKNFNTLFATLAVALFSNLALAQATPGKGPKDDCAQAKVPVVKAQCEALQKCQGLTGEAKNKCVKNASTPAPK